MSVTQSEADFLIAMVKKPTEINLPFDYTKRVIELIGSDGREEFLLDVTPGKINLEKITFQNRARKSVILARLDVEGPPHRNPDGTEVPCPHLHLYREGYGTKWAYSLSDQFSQCSNMTDFLDEFCKICNIVKNPYAQMPLF